MSILNALQQFFGVKSTPDEIDDRLASLEAKWAAPQQSVGHAMDAILTEKRAGASQKTPGAAQSEEAATPIVKRGTEEYDFNSHRFDLTIDQSWID